MRCSKQNKDFVVAKNRGHSKYFSKYTQNSKYFRLKKTQRPIVDTISRVASIWAVPEATEETRTGYTVGA